MSHGVIRDHLIDARIDKLAAKRTHKLKFEKGLKGSSGTISFDARIDKRDSDTRSVLRDGSKTRNGHFVTQSSSHVGRVSLGHPGPSDAMRAVQSLIHTRETGRNPKTAIWTLMRPFSDDLMRPFSNRSLTK